MSLLTNLFRLIPPTFKKDYCPKSLQELANSIINGTQLTFLIQQGNFLYNMGSTTPAPENRIFPWLYTPNGRWYTFQFGLWTAPMDPSMRDPTFRRMWKPAVGTPASAIWSVDEGSGADPVITPPTATTGASWELDLDDWAGRVPIGVGAIPDADPAKTLVLGDTGGVPQHKLTPEEGANSSHTHAFGVSHAGNDDAYFAKTGVNTVPSYTGYYITGSNGNIEAAQTTADLFTLPSGSDGKGVPDPTAFPTMPPYRAIYWAKPTIRKWYTLPA